MERLPEAQHVLDRIVANPQQAKWHSTAENLKDFVAAHLDPDGQLQKLSDQLTKVQGGPEFAHSLTDFTVLCDRKNGAPLGKSTLADWIAAFQA